MVRLLTSAMDPATRGWIVVTTGSVVRLSIGFIASVLIARAFGPSILGVYAALAALTATVGAFTEFGLTEAAVRRIAANWPDNEFAAGEAARAYVWLRTGASILVVTLLIVLLPFGEVLRVLPASPKYVLFALLGTIATGLSGATSGLLQASGRFGRLSLVMVANATLTAILAIVLRLSNVLTLTTALVILGAGTALACFGLGWCLLPAGLKPRPPNWTGFRQEAGPLLRFGRWLWLANTLAMLAAQLDLLLAGHWLSPAAVGAYALAVTLSSKVNVVNQSLHAALLPFASSLRSKAAVKSYLRRGLLRSLLIALVLLSSIPMARPLILTVFGAEYDGSIGLFLALIGVAAVDLIAAPVLLLTYTANRPKLIAAADAVRVAVLVLFAVMLLPSMGAFGLVTAKLLASIAGLVVTVVSLLYQFRSRGASLRQTVLDNNTAVQVE